MLDAIIIADTGNDTHSISSSMRLQLEGRPAVIQNIYNFIENKGKIVDPIIGENENNWHCSPKLNGITLLSRLLKEGVKAELIDSYYKERDNFIKLLTRNPKIIVISTTFILNKRSLYELVEDIRSLADDIYIIAGGPLIYSSYLLFQRVDDEAYDTSSPCEDFLFLSNNKRPDINLFIVDTRGTLLLSKAVKSVVRNKDATFLPNIAYWKNNQYVFSNRSSDYDDPNDFTIDWTLIPDHVFNYGVMNVQASNGCPFNCEFCNFVKEKKNQYIKPVDQLISELHELSKRGVRYVRFVDDNFRLGRNDLNDVCKKIIEADLGIEWMSFLRASTLEKTNMDLLKRSGCIEVQMGVESADTTVLNNMKKHANPELYSHVIRALLNNGINCSCCFIVGFPGETAESVQKTIDFIEQIPKPDQQGVFYWSIYPFLFAPLSPVYEPTKRKRYSLSGYMGRWKHFSMDSKEASAWIRKAFSMIKNSSPIYSGDNLDYISKLSPDQIKKFYAVRHNLAKKYMNQPIDNSDIIDSFYEFYHNN